MKDVMLDLETWGVGPTSVIVQIGACYFDRYTGEIGETFKINIDADSSIKEGFTVDADTIYWWMNQSNEARSSILADPKVHVMSAITKTNDFLEKADHIWSHAGFDFPKLEYHLWKLNLVPRFRYNSCKDIRTLSDLGRSFEINRSDRKGVHHDALDDCLHQVKYCVNYFNALGDNIHP